MNGRKVLHWLTVKELEMLSLGLTVCQGGRQCIADGFSGDVKLDIISVADDGTKGEHIEDK